MADKKRNFWITAEIDTPSGAKQILAGGPAAKDGGFKLKIAMLEDGETSTALLIVGRAGADSLDLNAYSPDGTIAYFSNSVDRETGRKRQCNCGIVGYPHAPHRL